MAGLSDGVSLLFRIRGDSSQAKSEISEFRKILDKELDAVEAKGETASKSLIDSNGRARDANGRFAASFKPIGDEAEKAADKSKSAFSSAFSGSFLGNLSASLSGALLSELKQLPSQIRSFLDEAVKIAEERANALKGLQSTAEFKGIDAKAAQDSVQNFRLVKAGIVDVSDGVTALKNLLGTGFSLPQANEIIERFSDAAAFGKQSALGFGEAIRGGTEGIKNQNSALVDNVGLTKNLSVILEERGFKLEDLSDKTKKQTALDALYKGILEETAAQVGDADKLTQGYTGAVAALDTAEKSLYATIGKQISQSPDVIAMFRLWSNEINGVTESLSDQDNQQAKTFSDFISWIARTAISAENFAKFTGAVLKDALNFSGSIITQFENVISYALKKVEATLVYAFDRFTDLYNGFASGINAIPATIGLPQLPTINRDTSGGEQMFYANDKQFLENYEAQQKYFQVEKGYFQNSRKALIDNADRLTEFQFLQGEIAKSLKETTDKAKKTAKESGAAGDSNSGGGEKSKKESLSSQQREFKNKVEDLRDETGFHLGRIAGANLQGKKGGSLHPLSLAADFGIKGKSVEEIVELLAGGIKKGLRALDERFVGALPGVKTIAPNAHFEANPRKASMFVENRPDLYGGQANLDYLKKLDADRLNKVTHKDDREKFSADRVKKEIEDNEKIVKEREKTDAHLLELWKQNGKEEKAELDNKLAQKLISENDYADRVAQIGIEDLETEKQLLEERLKMTQLSAERRADIEQKIIALTSEIEVKETEKSTDAIKRKTEALERQKTVAKQIAELRGQVAETEREALDVQKEGERQNLEANVRNATSRKARLDALLVLRDFEIGEIERHREEAIKDADAEEQRKKDDANKITDLEQRKAAVDALTQSYINLRDIINGKAKNEKEGVTVGAKPEIDEASKDRTIDDIFGENSDDKFNKAISQGKTLEGVFGSMGSVVVQSLKNMVAALGSAIEGYILYGQSIKKAMAQAAAAELAHIASVSAIKAIYQTAEGIAALFLNPGDALNHFAAAALYASLAVGAGAAGRSLAKSSGMYQQSNTANNAAAQNYDFRNKNSNGSSGGGGSSNGGDYYTQQKERIITEDRVLQSEVIHKQELTLKLDLGEDSLVKVFRTDVKNRGKLRDLILEVARDA